MEEQTTFLWTTILPFLWFLGLPLTVNLYWLRVKELNFSYLAFLILGSYFMVLYLQGEEWIAYASIPIILLFYFADRRFSLYYDFLRYNLNREKSYKKEKKQSRWRSWRNARTEDRKYQEFKEKENQTNEKRSNSDYESKRERTYPKDESYNFNKKRASTDCKDWPDIDAMSIDEIKKEWSVWQQKSKWTDEENDRMKLLKNAMTKKTI